MSKILIEHVVKLADGLEKRAHALLADVEDLREAVMLAKQRLQRCDRELSGGRRCTEPAGHTPPCTFPRRKGRSA